MKTHSVSARPPSDATLFVRVRRALDESLRVPATVHVHVNGGTVTLTGSVQWPFQRADADAAAGNVNGVQRVINELVITGTPPESGVKAQ
jgi:osmotically-inducible protein OsmY